MKKSGLGRNLDMLLGSRLSATPTTTAASAKETTTHPSAESIVMIPIEQLKPSPYQPRKQFDADALAELAASLKSQGMLQPIVARQVDSHFEIIAGERRWRAAQLAQLTGVPVVVREIDDKTASVLALVENLQREDLNPLEIAKGMLQLQQTFQLSQEALSQLVGKPRSTVANLLRLVNLNAEVQAWLAAGELEMGHARALLALTGLAQTQLARQVMTKKLSVRETERLVSTTLSAGDRQLSFMPPVADPNISHLENQLSERLGARVLIQHSSSGKGQMVIHYSHLDQLQGILQQLQVSSEEMAV